ncbi:YdcF family protein [Desertibacillus haloalkaliphilus]|uniref:YdcF family protein n=1 Tax=Desertibacillus haloalkaliphilus TaxID=1328930 RepID=UPI001C267A0F|nr:YdcF family protein [Desertibacillus haloalkaliphilus]MBU8906222.1 YdcF family protein [Desertibacillus haloalkaliphilus]
MTTRGKRLLRFVVMVFLCFSIWFVIHTAAVIIDGLNDELEKTEVGVVLGNKVERDGHPSERLQARLDKAIELYEDGYLDFIIVSGGLGVEGYDEAEVMEEYLVGHGVSGDSIFTDSNGYNTTMTAENARRIMGNLDVRSVTVITQYFHISRTKLAFEKQGFKEVRGAHAEIFEVRDFYSIVREFPAFYKYLLM